MRRSEEACQATDLLLGIPYFYGWQMSIYKLVMTNFVEIFTKMANFW
jgi:hypothetical protein